jgi:hypothetical protein
VSHGPITQSALLGQPITPMSNYGRIMATEDEIKSRFQRTSRSEFWTIERVLRIVVGACMLIIVGFGFVLYQQSVIRDRAEEQQLDIEANRAVMCRVLVAIGLELQPDGPCTDPDVAKFFDVEETARSESRLTQADRDRQALLDMTCQLIAAHELTSPDC